MTRARAHQPGVPMSRHAVYQEMTVWRVRVRAGRRRYRRPIQEGETALQEGSDRRLILLRHPSIDIVGGRDLAVVVPCGLDTMPHVGDAVEIATFIDLPDEDRHFSRVEDFRSRGWIEPEEYLPLALKREAKGGEQGRGPRSC